MVVTEDGYILTLMRVIRDQKDSEKIIKTETVLSKIPKRKKAVLMVHAFACSGDTWFLTNDLQNTLPSILLDEGYDCWVANMRGSTHSKHHTKFETNSHQFWDFSIDEVGKFDVPALIDYILKMTGNKKIFYIGHSVGCAEFFIAMSHRPEYCKKVESMVALTPFVYFSNMTSKPARILFLLAILFQNLGFFYRRATSELNIMDLAKMICPPNKHPVQVVHFLIRKLLPLTGLAVESQIVKGQYLRIAQSLPISTSMKKVGQACQWYCSGEFRQFDYGRSNNIKKYGQNKPPHYELAQVDVPILSICTKQDPVCIPKDVLKVIDELPNVVKHYSIGITETDMGHGDIVCGTDAPELIFKKITLFFKKQELP